MKNNKLLISTIVFFLIVNTCFFWDWCLGDWSMLVFLGMIVAYIALAFSLILIVFDAVISRTISRKNLLDVSVTTFVLVFTFFFPLGILPHTVTSDTEEQPLLMAIAEGAANCRTTFRLYENGRFMERNVCFGVNETWGNYEQRCDTLFFRNVELGDGVKEYYEFAIIKMDDKHGDVPQDMLYRYKSFSDTEPRKLWITDYHLQ